MILTDSIKKICRKHRTIWFAKNEINISQIPRLVTWLMAHISLVDPNEINIMNSPANSWITQMNHWPTRGPSLDRVT